MANGGLIRDTDALSLLPNRISILTSATQVQEPDERWTAGYSFLPEGCAPGDIYPMCEEPSATKTAYTTPLNGEDLPVIVEVVPFVVYTSYTTSTYSLKNSRDVDRLFQRLDERLAILTPFFMEQQLWSDSAGLGNPKIADSSATTIWDEIYPLQPGPAVAELEDVLSTCNVGGNAAIHMRPSMLDYLVFSQIVRRVGNVWLTPMDTLVIPGRGYPGTGPNGEDGIDTDWMFTTPQVSYRLGPIVHVPEFGVNSTEEAKLSVLRQATTRGTNDITVYAERYVSATFDPTCCRYAVQVAHPFDTHP
jgi:hypothetical protein